MRGESSFDTSVPYPLYCLLITGTYQLKGVIYDDNNNFSIHLQSFRQVKISM